MTDDHGANESRTLQGGEIIYLFREPGAKWRIQSYECRQGVAERGLLFVWLQGLSEAWRDREFDDPDQAASFAQQEIEAGNVPANRRDD